MSKVEQTIISTKPQPPRYKSICPNCKDYHDVRDCEEWEVKIKGDESLPVEINREYCTFISDTKIDIQMTCPECGCVYIDHDVKL